MHAGQRSARIRTVAIQCEDASRWQGAVISRVVYCTAVIDAATNPSGYNDQDIYLRALPAASGVDHVAYGSYVARVKYAPLAVKAASRSGGPQLVHPQWPVMVQDANGNPVPDATFMISSLTVKRRGLMSTSPRICWSTSSPVSWTLPWWSRTTVIWSSCLLCPDPGSGGLRPLPVGGSAEQLAFERDRSSTYMAIYEMLHI